MHSSGYNHIRSVSKTKLMTDFMGLVKGPSNVPSPALGGGGLCSQKMGPRTPRCIFNKTVGGLWRKDRREG